MSCRKYSFHDHFVAFNSSEDTNKAELKAREGVLSQDVQGVLDNSGFQFFSCKHSNIFKFHEWNIFLSGKEKSEKKFCSALV
jgi:hypothetical protein